MGRVQLINIEDRPTVPLKVWRKTRPPKKRKLLMAGLLFLFLASSTSAVAAYLIYHTYQEDRLLAQTGAQHLRSAATLLESLQSQPFAPQIVGQAQQEFASALSDAQAIKASLGSFSGPGGFVPVYGPRILAAAHLSALAVDISQVGISTCQILKMVLSHIGSPLNISASGLTSVDFTALSNEYQMVKTSLNAAMNEAAFLQPSDVSFDARLAKLLGEFQASIPMIRTVLSEVDQLLPALPTLLGISTPTHYLVEVLDSTELRPGGGFIGNYGIATLASSRLTSLQITDVSLLDKPFEFAGHTIPYPPAYSWFAHYLAPSSWSLRDSNLDADFPTDARNGELNFEREGGNVPLQGVIAITPFFIENVLKLTGPISVPEYHEMVSAQNLISLIHFHQLGAAGEGSSLVPSPDGHSSLRKRFTELFGEHLLARVQQLKSSDLAKFLRLMVSALQTKDIQLYFNVNGAEHALQLLQLDGSVKSPPGDHFALVDANVAVDKANSFIVNTVRDQVTLDQRGNAVHRTTITYAWTLPGPIYGHPLYQDYARVYVPLGSTLSTQEGWQPLGASAAFGNQVWAGFFTLVFGQTRTITLVWSSHAAATHDAHGWHYRYFLQRQAGAQRSLELQVLLPLCATVASNWGELIPKSEQEGTFYQPFSQDLSLGVDYACK